MKILLSIFRISYRALERDLYNRNFDFNSWSVFKRDNYEALNTLVFKYVSRSEFSVGDVSMDDSRQLLLDALHEILFDHYSQRLSIYDTCQRLRILNENSFALISLFISYKSIFRKVISSIYRSIKTRVVQFNVGSESTVVVTIGFPAHAFSVDKLATKNQSSIPCNFKNSFGEYFLAKYCFENGGVELISVDEFVRSSKSRESPPETQFSVNQNVSELARCNTTVIWSLSPIAVNIIEVFNQLIEIGRQFFKNKNHSLFVSIIYLMYWARSVSYIRMLSPLMSRVLSIYALPIGRPLGLLPYLAQIKGKLIYYSYSQNLCEPPTNYLNIGREFRQGWVEQIAIGDMSPDAWRLFGHSVGFTDIFEYINTFRKRVNTTFGYRLPVSDGSQKLQNPIMLGYEVVPMNMTLQSKRYIIVFDVPPEGRRSQYKRHFCGSPANEELVVRNFLTDIAEACSKSNFTLVVKPKYSLINYSKEYRDFLAELTRKYVGRVQLLSPYGRVALLLQAASASINMPYTSTKLICDSLGVKSRYYMPAPFKWDCEDGTIFGILELDRFLSEL